MFKGINEAAEKVHTNAVAHGWWDAEGCSDCGRNRDRSFGEVIALIHSEASEALEHYRNGLDPRVTFLTPEGKPDGIPIEMADIIIRVLDYCARMEIDIEAAMTRKHLYNTTRPHRHGGKVL